MKLKNLYLFRHLDEEEIRSSLHCSKAEVVSYQKGTYIFDQDDMPARLYIILSGTVSIGQTSSSGKEMYADFLGEGACFGETDLFLEKASYPYSAYAKTDVELLAVSKHFFVGNCSKNCTHHSKVLFNMLHLFAETADRNATKIQLLTRGTLRQRIAFYLQNLSNGRSSLTLPLNREELAVYLNATRPSLSRELSTLQDEGVLELKSRKEIEILDFDSLQNEVDGICE